MTHVTCRLTAKNRDQLRNARLSNRVCATFTLASSAAGACHRNELRRHAVLRKLSSFFLAEDWVEDSLMIISTNKKLHYLRRTTWRNLSVKILPNVEVSCTANPQQIAVMELEGYSWPTTSKQPRLVDCRISVIDKLDRSMTDEQGGDVNTDAFSAKRSTFTDCYR